MLGKMSDVDVAKATGRSAASVQYKRSRLRIPAYGSFVRGDTLGESALMVEATDTESVRLFAQFGRMPE
jgi:hypothetical protein